MPQHCIEEDILARWHHFLLPWFAYKWVCCCLHCPQWTSSQNHCMVQHNQQHSREPLYMRHIWLCKIQAIPFNKGMIETAVYTMNRPGIHVLTGVSRRSYYFERALSFFLNPCQTLCRLCVSLLPVFSSLIVLLCQRCSKCMIYHSVIRLGMRQVSNALCQCNDLSWMWLIEWNI